MTIHDVLSDGLALSISQSCQALDVSRSGYYKWRIQPEIAPTDSEDVDLKNQIQEIAMEFTGYGYRRMTAELQNPYIHLPGHHLSLFYFRSANPALARYTASSVGSNPFWDTFTQRCKSR